MLDEDSSVSLGSTEENSLALALSHAEHPRPPTDTAVWVPGASPFQPDPELLGESLDHEMGIVGEVAKFLWFLCQSIREEPDAVYIMATEFTEVCVPMLLILERDWSYKKAVSEATKIFTSALPAYLLHSQKMDFLCFTDALYKLSDR